LFPLKTVQLEWKRPVVKRGSRGSCVVFPGPSLARKGAYELRDAVRSLDSSLLVLNAQTVESKQFWSGVQLAEASGDWLHQAAVVVQPAFIENNPRPLLRALAADNKNAEVAYNLSLTEYKLNKQTQALDYAQKAVALDGENLRARYSLALETERQQNSASSSDAMKLLDQILKLRPQNEPVLLDLCAGNLIRGLGWSEHPVVRGGRRWREDLRLRLYILPSFLWWDHNSRP
jgi:tetratricopeptide (TPR) repeat protein